MPVTSAARHVTSAVSVKRKNSVGRKRQSIAKSSLSFAFGHSHEAEDIELSLINERIILEADVEVWCVLLFAKCIKSDKSLTPSPMSATQQQNRHRQA